LPKKSWRIKFPDRDNPFDAKAININAEYRDKSLLRNHLAMSLFLYYGYPAPATRHVNLVVNDQYLGVHLLVEDIDNVFFNKRGRPDGDLFKAMDHGATMAPLAHYDDYAATWEKKEGEPGAYKKLQLLFNKFLYLPEPEFNSEIVKIMAMDQVLTYFAIEYAITAEDCFTKNMNLYYNPDTEGWEIIPWDNDITFGNSWQGDYAASMETKYRMKCLYHNQLLQRLLDKKEWNSLFVDKINTTLTDGFTYLAGFLDSTYNIIKCDVWQDSTKRSSNREFDEERAVLQQFLHNRAVNNAGQVSFPKTGVDDFYCSNPNPTPDDNKVIFRIRSAQKQPVTVIYSPDLHWEIFGCKYTIKTLTLWDDGKHNDFQAGDLIYGNELTITQPDSNLIPFCFTGSNYNYPHNGLYNLQQVRTNTMTLLYSKAKNPVENVRIGNVYTAYRDYFIELRNTGSQNIDLSCFHVRVDTCYQDFIIPENTTLKANSSLYIVSDKNFTATLSGFSPAVGNICFTIAPGDSIHVLSPLLQPVASAFITTILPVDYEKTGLVINEINYHSGNDFNPGDWLEFYNPDNRSVNLSGWEFKDENDAHVFVFPQGTEMAAHGFLTLCEDITRFKALFPDVNVVTENFTFNLANEGELLRLYDAGGALIDSVRYDDHSPWPAAADGDGPTLELIQPDRDNSLPENWGVSQGHGTPGAFNSVSSGINNPEHKPEMVMLYQNYPNPFNGETRFTFHVPDGVKVRLDIYNLWGQLVETLYPAANQQQICWKAGEISAGIYFVALVVNGLKRDVRKVVLLK